jgi:hypothetical protein
VIKAYAGHEEVSTTLGYMKRVSGPMADAYGTPFPPLPESLTTGAENTAETPPWTKSWPSAWTTKKLNPAVTPGSLAERVGFEPTVQFPVRILSKDVP